jgi:branched-chain amino acid transport system substrate-binding protein
VCEFVLVAHGHSWIRSLKMPRSIYYEAMKRILLVLILALAIQVAPSSVASEEDSVTNTSVTFGASYPQTGAASLGTRSYYSGINAYFSYVNDNGGVYGRKIGFTLKDDMFVPSQAIAKANEFVLTDKVFGFI